MEPRKTAALTLENCDCSRSCSWQMNSVPEERKLIHHPKYAQLKTEFQGFILRPHLPLEAVGIASGQKARWACSEGHFWDATIADIIGKDIDCKKCSSRENGMAQIKRNPPAKENQSQYLNQAIRVVKYPELKPAQLKLLSNLVLEWQCKCGIKFLRKMSLVSRHGAVCSTCRNSASSRFEYEIAFLLQTYFPRLKIIQQYKKDSYLKTIDIYIKELDLALEIDPFQYHQSKLESDARIAETLKGFYQNVIRVRDSRLPNISDSITIPSINNMVSKKWAEAISQHKIFEDYLGKPPTSEEIQSALIKANEKWDKNLQNIKNPASENETIQKAFIKNLTHPGRTIDFTPITSNDNCLWLCLECGNQYEQRIARVATNILCPNHKGEKIRQGRLTGKHQMLLAETHPEILAQIKTIIDYPQIDKNKLSTNSKLKAEFICEKGHPSKSVIAVRTRRENYGCPDCLKLKGISRKINVSETLKIKLPEVYKEYQRNLSHPDKDPLLLSYNSADKCVWQCEKLTHPERVSRVNYRARKYGHCKECLKI